MNRERVSKMAGKRIKVRPVARRFELTGAELPPIDDIWIIQSTSKDEITLANPRTGHSFPLGMDQIREYLTDRVDRSDAFLVLKSQIILKGRGVSVEPLL
jgi:hypothetical protein